MGGKHKQAQRTKNNVRPSSSGRSAELLGNSTPTFVGFTAVKDGGFAPVLPGFSITSVDDLDPNLNPNFHLVLKKMGKKDSITKLKALQEFSELIKKSEPEAVKAVLPLWPRLYCHLAVDVEHRVREAAHQAQRAVVMGAKRNLAPYLRQLVGPWFTSQYDTYPPAATAAALAFQDAFPPNKVIDAIIFCQEEILNYICDNLIVQTPQTLSNPKVVTAEEMEAKYQRVVVSSLQGYALYLHKLPAEQLKNASDANKKLIASKKFWKFSKHSSALIRNAWFQALIAVCQKAPDLLSDEGSHVALAVFGNLDENDPTVLPTVWEACLHVLTTVQDCWKHVSAEKLVLPKLWHILREGGQGNASTIFPNLLPLLSKIPSDICSNKENFYDKFFGNMRQGLNQKCVTQSSAESNAIAKCYIECVRYIVILHLNDSSFCQSLVQNQLIPAIDVILSEQKMQLLSSAFFSQISELLINHWNNQEYAGLATLFWDLLTSVLLKSLSASHNKESSEPRNVPSGWQLDRQVNLCLYLKNPKRIRSNQKLKVKFDSSENESEEFSPEKETLSCVPDEPQISEGLKTMVHVFSASCLKKVYEYRDPVYLEYLARLIVSFESRDLFKNLLYVSYATEEEETQNDAPLLEFYNSVLHKWLQDDKMCTKDVINITFSLMKFLTNNEKNQVLESLCKVTNRIVFVWSVKASLNHRMDPSISSWLQSSQLSNILVSIATDLCSYKCSQDAQHILKSCLSKTEDGELIISTNTFSDILSVFSQALSLSNVKVSCLEFVTELVISLYSGDLLLSPFLQSNPAAEELILALFRSSCINRICKKEVDDAWCTGVTALARMQGCHSEQFLSLAHKFANVTKKELLVRDGISIECVDRIITTVVLFISASVNCFPAALGDKASNMSTAVQLCLIFLDALLPVLEARENILTSICLYAEQVKGLLSLNSSYSSRLCKDNIKDVKTIDGFEKKTEDGTVMNFEEGIMQYITIIMFSVSLIFKLPESWNVPDDYDDYDSDSDSELQKEKHKGEEAAKKIKELSMDVQSLKDHFLVSIYVVALFESFNKHYKNSMYYYKMSSDYSILKQRFQLLMRNIGTEAKEYVIQDLRERTRRYGGLWLQAVYLLYTEVFKDSDLCTLYSELTSNMDATDTVNTVHISQVFSQFVKVEDLKTDTIELNIDKLVMVTCWLNQVENSVPTEFNDSILEMLNCILVWYQQSDKTERLFDCEVKQPQSTLVAAISRFLTAVVEKCPHLLTADLWDTVIVSLASWILSVKHCQQKLLIPSDSGTPPLVECFNAKSKQETINSDIHHSKQIFVISIFGLFRALSNFLSESFVDSDCEHLKKFHEKLSSEWKDVFAEDVNEVLISTFCTTAGMVEINCLALLDLPVLESLGMTVLKVDSSYFFPSDSSKCNNISSDKMIAVCCKLILSSVIPLQLTAYHMLLKLIPDLVELDTPAAFAAAAADKEGDGLSLSKLQDTLLQTQTVVDTMLMEIRLGNNCTIRPFTDAHTYTTAYLLLWSVVLDMCGLAISELRYQYATMLRESNFLKSLLNNVFRLMPEQVLQTTDHPKFKLQKTTEMFAKSPPLMFSQYVSSEALEHLSCWVYYNALRRLPALVRQWWSDAEFRVAKIMEQVTEIHCAPLLCAEEMRTIKGKALQHGNMTVKVHPTVHEVVAVYKVDESRMELSIRLPRNYPLGPVHVESEKQLVDTGQWRNWMMQLTVFLTHQNGTIWDGLTLWKSNLDKRFEGVEECYICFSILHGSNFQIPRLCCSTCKKKFHSPCLYKWFSTSNKATCPICRNLF